MKIAVALSGGVDSATCVYLLKQQFPNAGIIGITLKLTNDYIDKEGCAIWKSRKLCERFDIKHYVIDYTAEFQNEVIDRFNKETQNGLTPVPCIYCNRHIKIGKLLEFCRENGAKLATGHYAKIENINGENRIFKAKDTLKDQTHFLCDIKKEDLKDLIFPLGNYLKSEVFRIAKEQKLVNIETYKESQEVCFFNGKTYKEYVKSLKITEKTGDILHIKTNKKLGAHNGLLKYTIGQRQGLGIAWSEPLYVVARDFTTNTLFVGEENCLYSAELEIENVNILSSAFENKTAFDCDVCLRDKTPLIKATIKIDNNDKTKAKLLLKQPARAITKGQWCVFYNENEMIGGGVIK